MFKIPENIKSLPRIVGNAAYKFYWDDGFSRAGALAYTTLFALVPITALTVSILPSFGLDHEQLGILLKKIINQVLPPIENEQLQELQNQVYYYLDVFSSNVKALNVVSIAALVFTSIALLNTIESALNIIWRVTSNLSIVSKIISFWAVISLGPLLIAVSIFWTTQVATFTENSGAFRSVFFDFVDVIVPVMGTWGALTLLFFKLPAAKVRLVDAALGAFIAAVLFEYVKRGFAYYIGLSATYSKIYGVLASIPLFLFWLYIAWAVVLFGAQICYIAGNIQILKGRRKFATDLGEIGAILGLRILYSIGRNFLEGKPPLTEGEIAIETGSDPVLVRSCLDLLSEARILTFADGDLHARTLLVAPGKLTVGDVIKTFFSKSHLMKNSAEDETALVQEDTMFLELLRRASANGGKTRDLRDWTLEQLITA